MKLALCGTQSRAPAAALPLARSATSHHFARMKGLKTASGAPWRGVHASRAGRSTHQPGALAAGSAWPRTPRSMQHEVGCSSAAGELPGAPAQCCRSAQSSIPRLQARSRGRDKRPPTVGT